MKPSHTYLALGAALAAWFLAAGVTVLQWGMVRNSSCLFLNNWPGCGQVAYAWQALYVGLIVGLLGLGAYGLWRHWSGTSTWRLSYWLVVVCLVFSLVCGFALVPFSSGDVQFYFSVGRSVVEGHNPYQDSWTRTILLVEPAQTSVETGVMYGPLMVRLFGIVYEWASGELLWFMVYWKLLMIATWAAVLGGVFYLLRVFDRPMDKRMYLVFWLAQPLVLWEWVGNGHFDGLWVLATLGAYVAAKKQQWAVVAACLTIGVWLKFIPIIIVPWFVLWWWQGTNWMQWVRMVKQIMSAAIAAVFVTWVSWVGLWGGPSVFGGLVRQSKWAVSSLFATIYYTLFPVAQSWLGDRTHLVVTSLVQGGLLVFALYLAYPYILSAWKLARKKIQWSEFEYVQAVYCTLLVYLLVWQKSFWPWYFAWLIPFGLIVTWFRPTNYNRALLAALSFVPLLFYVPQQWQGGRVDTLPMAYFVSLVILAPPLYWLWQWRQKKYDLV